MVDAVVNSFVEHFKHATLRYLVAYSLEELTLLGRGGKYAALLHSAMLRSVEEGFEPCGVKPIRCVIICRNALLITVGISEVINDYGFKSFL